MQDALSHGLPNFNPRFRSPLLKPSTSPCLSPYVTSFLIWGYYRKRGSKMSMSCVPSPMCTVRFLKTILVPLNWQGYLNFTLGPSILTYATIIFANMYARDSSRSSLWTPRTGLLMHLPNHLWYFGIYVRVSCTVYVRYSQCVQVCSNAYKYASSY